MTDYEKKVLLDAIAVLQRSTCNSLDLHQRQRWRDRRDDVVDRLERMAR